MFYEEFSFSDEENLPSAEYDTDDLKIIYYLCNMSDGIDDFMRIVIHEWLHGLFDWATEGAKHEEEKISAEKDHFIMKVINFY